MCHTERIEFFGNVSEFTDFSDVVDGITFDGAGRNIAIFPDIFGLTDFYKGYASYLADQGATVHIVNIWSGLGGEPTLSREEAYARKHKLKEFSYCNQIEQFLKEFKIDAILGFCLGGNFSLEMARRGFSGTNISIYPLPWGMENQDPLTPAFDYMPTLKQQVNIFMGEADYLAGPENIDKLKNIVTANKSLSLNLYEGSDHGFFTDIDGENEQLKTNAHDAIKRVNKILFANK